MAALPGARLLEWYRRAGRDLPWRRRPNPYRVWISEVMLQQTTVATAGPYFERFVARYPTVRALAAARERDVLALWSGLGYYHRARNLVEAARIVVRKHRAKVPTDPESLRALPGVGAYTAGAILSIGHNLPYPALDGNIIRVAARLGGVRGDPARAATRRAIERLVREWMPRGEASAFNQAMMDLGATICLPRRPACGVCPVASQCSALGSGLVDRIPPARAGKRPRRVELAALAVRRGGRVLLVERGEGRLMKGMWEYPLVPAVGVRQLETQARRLGARVVRRAGSVRHTITRHRIAITVYEARPARGAPPGAGTAALAVSEPAAGPASSLATPLTGRAARWASLALLADAGGAGLPITGAARKITRLLLEGR